MGSFEKFKERLSSKEYFYSSLTGKKVSDKEYEHVLQVRDISEMKTRKKYHDLYLKFDVLLSADVFEKFRYSSLKNDALRLINYLITTALGWDAMLSMTKVEFEAVSEADICLFFEKGMRDGVSYVSKKSSKVNNKDL